MLTGLCRWIGTEVNMTEPERSYRSNWESGVRTNLRNSNGAGARVNVLRIVGDALKQFRNEKLLGGFAHRLSQKGTVMKVSTATLGLILALSSSLACAQGGSAGGSAGSGSTAGASGGATGTGSTSATTGMQGTTGTKVGGGVNSQQGVGSTPGTSTEGPNQGTTRPGSSGKK